MKKSLLLLLTLPLALFASLSAQTTQEQADSIVWERINSETKPYTLYTKDSVQTEGITVTTSIGEVLELDYPCWVYYVNYTNKTIGKYLIVKENNGSLLEINTKNDTGQDDLAKWRELTENEEEEEEKGCKMNNPLTDLLWLKEMIKEFEETAEMTGYNPHARIYQCNYKDSTGFLLEMCVECPDVGYSFRNCEGAVLCSDELLEENNCSEFNIDFDNKKLIWEVEETIKSEAIEFAPIGAEWYYTYTYGDSPDHFHRVVSEEDTMINGYHCRIVRQYTDNSNIVNKEYIFRQKQGKVYYYYQNQFNLLYDFDAQINDTVNFLFLGNWLFFDRDSTPAFWYADTVFSIKCIVESITLNAQNLKIFTTKILEEDWISSKFDYYFPSQKYIYTEKIGLYREFFTNLIEEWYIPELPPYRFFRCYSDAEIDIREWYFPCDYNY